MDLGCSQIVLNVSDLDRSRSFYVEKLGFPVIESHPTMFAFRAGGVRFSVFGGGKALDMERDPANTNIMFRSDDIHRDVARLRAQGVDFFGDVQAGGGSMQHISFTDPDNNLLYLAQYEKDPLAH